MGDEEAGDATLVCPITQEPFVDPVICVGDGHTYERSAIQKWFRRGKYTSPLTGAQLTTRTLVPNHTLRQAIEQWQGGSSRASRSGRTRRGSSDSTTKDGTRLSSELGGKEREKSVTSLPSFVWATLDQGEPPPTIARVSLTQRVRARIGDLKAVGRACGMHCIGVFLMLVFGGLVLGAATGATLLMVRFIATGLKDVQTACDVPGTEWVWITALYITFSNILLWFLLPLFGNRCPSRPVILCTCVIVDILLWHLWSDRYCPQEDDLYWGPRLLLVVTCQIQIFSGVFAIVQN